MWLASHLTRLGPRTVPLVRASSACSSTHGASIPRPGGIAAAASGPTAPPSGVSDPPSAPASDASDPPAAAPRPTPAPALPSAVAAPRPPSPEVPEVPDVHPAASGTRIEQRYTHTR